MIWKLVDKAKKRKVQMTYSVDFKIASRFSRDAEVICALVVLVTTQLISMHEVLEFPSNMSCAISLTIFQLFLSSVVQQLCNLASPPAGWHLTLDPRACPYSIPSSNEQPPSSGMDRWGCSHLKISSVAPSQFWRASARHQSKGPPAS